jgi:hypothetical protein
MGGRKLRLQQVQRRSMLRWTIAVVKPVFALCIDSVMSSFFVSQYVQRARRISRHDAQQQMLITHVKLPRRIIKPSSA